MDTATLFAFAATFPEQFAEMMDACAEHVELEGHCYYNSETHACYVRYGYTSYAGE